MTGERRFLLAGAVLVLAVVATLVISIRLSLLPPTMAFLGYDWDWYRDGMERVLNGLPLYDPRLLSGPYQQLAPDFGEAWNQMPAALAVVAPFYLLPEGLRPAAWLLFNLGCIAVALWLVWPRGLVRRENILLGGAVLLSPVVLCGAYFANLSTLAALGVAITWLGWRRKSTKLMMIGLLCAGIIKVYPAVTLGLFLITRRRWRPVVLAALIVTGLTLPAVLLYGPNVIVDFVRSQLNASISVIGANVSPRAVAFHYFGIVLPSWIGYVLGGAFTVVGLLPRWRPNVAFVWLSLAACLFASNLWLHWLLVPLVAMLIALPSWTWFSLLRSWLAEQPTTA